MGRPIQRVDDFVTYVSPDNNSEGPKDLYCSELGVRNLSLEPGSVISFPVRAERKIYTIESISHVGANGYKIRLKSEGTYTVDPHAQPSDKIASAGVVKAFWEKAIARLS